MAVQQRLIGFHTIHANPSYYSENAIVGRKLERRELRTFTEYESACRSAGCTYYNEETFNEYLDEMGIKVNVLIEVGKTKSFGIVLYDNGIEYKENDDTLDIEIPASKLTKVLELAEKWQTLVDLLPPPPKEVSSKHYKIELSYHQLEEIFKAGYLNHFDGFANPDFDKFMLKKFNIKFK